MTTIYKVWLMRGDKAERGYPRIYESLSGFTAVKAVARNANARIERNGQHWADKTPFTVKLEKLEGQWSDAG